MEPKSLESLHQIIQGFIVFTFMAIFLLRNAVCHETSLLVCHETTLLIHRLLPINGKRFSIFGFLFLPLTVILIHPSWRVLISLGLFQRWSHTIAVTTTTATGIICNTRHRFPKPRLPCCHFFNRLAVYQHQNDHQQNTCFVRNTSARGTTHQIHRTSNTHPVSRGFLPS